MCGIAGKIIIGGTPKKREIDQMLETIAHRGPDDMGISIVGQVGLGHRRLAIIDLSPKGHQPMSYANGRYTITFNGEIYNYQTLRNLLSQKGYTFSSMSDTEIILAMYQEFGVECLYHFNGMFAFAIYDKKENILFAARDRLGEKPFKYFFDGKTFIFASELKAILTQSEVSSKYDIQAIKEYLYWGFVPSPKTGYKDINKLPAAHYLLFKNGKVTTKRYWDFSNKINTFRTEKKTKETLRDLLYESVRLRMISDVPIGSFLSGGIDSCVVTGIMSELSKKQVRTYTIGIEGWGDNEAPLAKISAEYHNTKHELLYVKPNISKLIPLLAKAYEEPFGDTSAIPSYYVSQATRKHVTVALNGDGGDENFCGYSNYTTLIAQDKLQYTKPIATLAYAVLSPFKEKLWKYATYQRALRVSDLLKDDVLTGYARHARSYLNIITFSDLFNESSPIEIDLFTQYLPKERENLVSSVTWADLHNVLPDGLMPKMDIASMQNSLETRAPLLDHQLVEFAATIPTELKYKNGQTKWIFKETFKKLIPPEVLKSPKRGFVMPMGDWLRHELQPLLKTALQDPEHQIYSILRYDTVQKMMKYHIETEIDYTPYLWRILMLSLWMS